MPNAKKWLPGAYVQGDRVRLTGESADTGPGVPADRREEIFQPFSQTEEGVRLGGAGLGLAVCRQIVERMDATLSVRDNPAGGALFVFEAPLFQKPCRSIRARRRANPGRCTC